MIDIAEEEPSVDPKATERDGDVPSLPSPAMGVRSVARIRYKGLQSPRSQSELAFEAGYNDGYGDGYVDGYDDGRYNQLIGLIKEYEEWRDFALNDVYEREMLIRVVKELRGRLEHDGRP